MSSEWMKVMLEEISRKKAQAEQARAEEQTRAAEQARADERRRVVIESPSAPGRKNTGDAE
jgi:hypothetical protein